MGGEAGVGKTRLVSELVARATAAGATPSWAAVSTSRTADCPSPRLSRRCATTRSWASWEAGRRRSAPRPKVGSSSSPSDCWGGWRPISPLLLVLEDLHWSDRSTRDLLAFLVRNLRAERIVLVATYRSDELHRGHPLRAFLAELDRGRRTRRLDLLPFSRAELGEHLEGILGARPERPLVDSVFERSQGNAFFAEELVTIESEGTRHELPPMLRDILLVRIESRSAAARELLRVVAAAGARVPERLLATVSQLSEAQRDEALREAVEHRLLVSAGEDVYAFRHALLREAVYQELLPGERNRLHAACGAALAAAARARGR